MHGTATLQLRVIGNSIGVVLPKKMLAELRLNAAASGDPDVAELGALYALCIAHNHPFSDGDKRMAWTAMVVSHDNSRQARSRD